MIEMKIEQSVHITRLRASACGSGSSACGSGRRPSQNPVSAIVRKAGNTGACSRRPGVDDEPEIQESTRKKSGHTHAPTAIARRTSASPRRRRDASNETRTPRRRRDAATAGEGRRRREAGPSRTVGAVGGDAEPSFREANPTLSLLSAFPRVVSRCRTRQPRHERAPRDAEDLRGASLIAGALRERVEDALVIRHPRGIGERRARGGERRRAREPPPGFRSRRGRDARD